MAVLGAAVSLQGTEQRGRCWEQRGGGRSALQGSESCRLPHLAYGGGLLLRLGGLDGLGDHLPEGGLGSALVFLVLLAQGFGHLVDICQRVVLAVRHHPRDQKLVKDVGALGAAARTVRTHALLLDAIYGTPRLVSFGACHPVDYCAIARRHTCYVLILLLLPLLRRVAAKGQRFGC